MKTLTLTIEIATAIQTEVDRRTHAGYEDMAPVVEVYTEQGYEQGEVEDIVREALTELAKYNN